MTPELQYSDGGNPKLDPLVREKGETMIKRDVTSLHQFISPRSHPQLKLEAVRHRPNSTRYRQPSR